jgi:hypothetical protein
LVACGSWTRFSKKKRHFDALHQFRLLACGLPAGKLELVLRRRKWSQPLCERQKILKEMKYGGQGNDEARFTLPSKLLRNLMEIGSDVMISLTARKDMKAFVPMGCYKDPGALTSLSARGIE